MSKDEYPDNVWVLAGTSVLLPVELYSGSGSTAETFGAKRPEVSLFCPTYFVFASVATCCSKLPRSYKASFC
jgi:hypothetical protein